MTPRNATPRGLALCTALAILMLPTTEGDANDTDLFRTNVPPNILLMVDNSSSMANQVWHTDYGLQIDEGGTLKPANRQTECQYFRDTLGMGGTKFSIYVDPKRHSYQDGDGVTMRYRDAPNWWETIPVRDPSGNPMFNDIDMDGVQDAGEVDMFYRFPDPTQSEAGWLGATDDEHKAIKDVWGNHLFWDQNGNGVQEAGERDLYYAWNTSKNKPRGTAAKIVSRITPVTTAIAARIDTMTLEISNDDICGVDATGWSLFDGNDPLAAAPSGVVMKMQPVYLDWLFSSHGSVAREATFTPTNGNDGIRTKSGCVTLIGSEGPTYETLRRSRIQALTLILRTVICEVNQVGDVRFGFAQFRFAGKGGDDNGGYVAVPINDWFDENGDPNEYGLHGLTDSHENHLRRVIRTSAPDAQTPLAESLFQLYTYFMSREVDELPYGRDWEGNSTGVRFPVYNYDTSLYNPLGGYDPDEDDFPPNLEEVGGKYVGPIPLDPDADADPDAAPDPLLYACQKNFILFITDGFSSGDDFTDNDDKINEHFEPVPAVETHTDVGFSDFVNLIGDHYRADSDGTPDEVETTAGTKTYYMDDVAYFMNRWDFRPDEDDMPGEQTIDIYTVGYSTESEEGGEVSTVEKAALRGNGSYFESSDADKLADDIVAAITDMIDKAQAFTSATVPASRTTDGNNFYSSFFLPKDDTGFWEGHLKNFEFSPLGDILTADGHCATGSDINATPPCAGGTLRTFEDGFWDAAEAIPDPADRKLFVGFGFRSMFLQPYEMRPAAGAAAGIWAGLFSFVDGVDQLDPPYDALSPNTPGDMMLALVGVLRGCEFGSAPCVPRSNDAGDKIYLGDIFHSNPTVVGSPNAPINEPSYRLFAGQYLERPRVIYAGANDGFLHGFHAGDWKEFESDGMTPLVPPRHDRGTGEELFGFMPSEVRTVIKELPKKLSFPRGMETVDGSPIAADAWFYRNASMGDLTSVNPLLTPHDNEAARWRTVLIGGLRNGGMSYYALDITEPTASASEVSTSYPRSLWGFPCDWCGSAANPNSASETTYMGYTWSEPVITRVRVKADFGTDPRGYDRWVAIFGAGYHPHGDPNGSDYREVGDAGFTPKGRGIYMVDITTGEVLAKKVFDDGASPLTSTRTPQVGISEFHYAFASAPAVFDLDFDGYADVIYIGDLGGNVWKWVVRAIGHDPINNGSPNNDLAQPTWPFKRFFRAGTSLEPTLAGEQIAGDYDQSVHYQSFFFPPTGALRNGRLVLAFGAGERANAKGPDSAYGDGDASDNNHFYVIKEDDPLGKTAADPHPIDDSIVEADLQDLDDEFAPSCSEMRATRQGYYITARDAEKFITNSIIFLGTVFTGSFMPPDPADSDLVCEASGQAFFYAFDLDCGVGLFTSNPGTDAEKRRKAIGSGIPTRPRVSVGQINRGGGDGGGGGGGPCSNRVVVITSDGFIENDCPGTAPSSGVNVRTWRER